MTDDFSPPPPEEQLTADQQEANSIRYVIGLRLCLLQSGNWAIFANGLQLQGIWPELPAEILRQIGEQERDRITESSVKYEIEQDEIWRPLREAGPAAKTAEEMGL